MSFAVIILIILVVIILWAVLIYNGLVGAKNNVKNAFSQIDVQLKRRFDLIPNLVETAKGYLAHERATLEAVMKARSGAVSAAQTAAGNPIDPQAIQNLAAANGVLTQSLGRLFAVAEAYPDLKANANMMQLSEELTSTENKVSFARQAYNDSVMGYNTRLGIFPSNVVAGLFGFREASMLESTESPEERKAPKVSF